MPSGGFSGLAITAPKFTESTAIPAEVWNEERRMLQSEISQGGVKTENSVDRFIFDPCCQSLAERKFRENPNSGKCLW